MKKLLTISILLFLASCHQDHGDAQYLRWVGDSQFDPEMDGEEFQLCNSENLVKQYFYFGQGLKYQGEKIALKTHFKNTYVPVQIKQSGWIRIRFIMKKYCLINVLQTNCWKLRNPWRGGPYMKKEGSLEIITNTLFSKLKKEKS